MDCAPIDTTALAELCSNRSMQLAKAIAGRKNAIIGLDWANCTPQKDPKSAGSSPRQPQYRLQRERRWGVWIHDESERPNLQYTTTCLVVPIVIVYLCAYVLAGRSTHVEYSRHRPRGSRSRWTNHRQVSANRE